MILKITRSMTLALLRMQHAATRWRRRRLMKYFMKHTHRMFPVGIWYGDADKQDDPDAIGGFLGARSVQELDKIVKGMRDGELDSAIDQSIRRGIYWSDVRLKNAGFDLRVIICDACGFTGRVALKDIAITDVEPLLACPYCGVREARLMHDDELTPKTGL